MRLPSVLIIGAMKAGSTGMYMDLTEHPSVFLAEDKEPAALCYDDTLTESGKARYAAIYSKAAENMLLCDASTGYSKRPDFEGVADRATRILPAGFKVIYMVRHPVRRIISQHYHEYTEGIVGANIDETVRKHPRYINYSRFAYQIEPWIDAVGIDRVRVVRFEDYVERRQETLAEICEFLELAPNLLTIDEAKIYNKSDGKPVRNRFWDAVYRNPIYRNVIRPWVSPKVRLKLYEWLLPTAPARPEKPQPETVQWLVESLAEEVHRLSELLKLDAPLWDDFAPESEVSQP